MQRINAQSPQARQADDLVRHLQSYLVKKLETLSASASGSFQVKEWLRSGGRHGGGERFVAQNEQLFNRASVNVSQVHYDDDPQKSLGSATALSTIVHPQNPFAPSLHMHISWTELKTGRGYWRIMADLNPSTPDEQAKERFIAVLKQAAPDLYDQGARQGERYFYIPALGRHRGVAHFYLEEFASANQNADRRLAQNFGEAVASVYVQIVADALAKHPQFSASDKQRQLAYHSLYFLQVLSLDRGTTSGLLVHNENDVGILGSLPSHVDRNLLASWVSRLPPPQDSLLKGLLDLLPQANPCLVDDGLKASIAECARRFYRDHPQALDMLARGDVIPSTKENHGAPAK